MKKMIIVILEILVLFSLFGCEKHSDEELTKRLHISIINNTEVAKVWILPDTEENRGTTLWGAPAANKAGEEKQTVSVKDVSKNGKYIFRMIDDTGMFYESDDIFLSEGQTVIVRYGDIPMSAVLEVMDQDDALVCEYPVFMAKL